MLLAGGLGGIKLLQIKQMAARGAQSAPPPEPVTTAPVRQEQWERLLNFVGSLEALQGITVTAELAGKVVHIDFEAGSKVHAGDLLLRQDTASEEAQLRAAEAALSLARLTFERDAELRKKKIIPQSEYDDAEAKFKEARAQADNIRAVIRKKTIRAPFAGRLGIRLADLGQVLQAGDPIVSLQSIDPIFVNFYVPQQLLAMVRRGLTVRVTTDVLPGRVVAGGITAINPQVDAATRTLEVQATVPNPEGHLLPGMFVDVAVLLPERQKVMAIPATAVLYAPYSDSVFVVEEKKGEKGTGPEKVVRQQFIEIGDKRGDFVAVVSGLKANETVVSTGVFKLRNGQAVTVDNSLSPEFKLVPKPEDK